MQIEKPPTIQDQELATWIEKLWQKIHEDHLYGSTTHDFGSIANGGMEAVDVTVEGAELGDHAKASLDLDVADLVLDAQVTAADTVTCVAANNTGGAVVLSSTTVFVRVFKKIT